MLNRHWSLSSEVYFTHIILISLYICFGVCYPKSEQPCVNAGGECVYNYRGCPGGVDWGYVDKELCPGGDVWVCCLPYVMPVPSNRSLTKMCYECVHTSSENSINGSAQCMDGDHWKPESAENIVINQMNCTGQCLKKWIRLDEFTYTIERGCERYCSEYSFEDNYVIHCCDDELCNSVESLHKKEYLFQIVITLLSFIYSALQFI